MGVDVSQMTQLHIHANNKENAKTQRHWPFVWGFPL